MKTHYLTGFKKTLIYGVIAIHVIGYYLCRPSKFHWSLVRYCRFLKQAFHLLLIFRHNKVVRVFNGYKLHLYLPAYPSKAFFYAIESKLCKEPPSPITIVFSITKACRYKCQHCYQRNDQNQELTESAMIATAQKMQDLGVAMFDIEGGEPLLRYERLLHLVEFLDDRSEIWINTTGDNLTGEKLLELADKKLFGMMISIHSPDPQKHDAFTGIAGSFQTACSALRLCRKNNLVTAINSVLSEEEIKSGKLDNLMALAKELDCDYVQLIHPKPAGKWLGHTAGMQTNPDLLAKIRLAHIYYNSSKTKDFPSLSAQAFEESPEVLGCTAGGIDRFYLNASGELQPCEFLNISFGNVQSESFETIYARMRSAFPYPCCDWLCCARAQEIYAAFQNNQITIAPLPWEITQKLVQNWQGGTQTPLYKKLNIYHS